MKKHETKEETEERDAAGYARTPSDARDIEEWESEQVWFEYKEREPKEAVRPTTRTGGGTKAMDAALERATEIRGKLEGRHHSDSTPAVSDDRQR